MLLTVELTYMRQVTDLNMSYLKWLWLKDQNQKCTHYLLQIREKLLSIFWAGRVYAVVTEINCMLGNITERNVFDVVPSGAEKPKMYLRPINKTRFT